MKVLSYEGVEVMESRLEEIKSELNTTNAFDYLPDWRMEVKWLIEQAEKIEQYEHALMFYADEQSWKKIYDGHMGFHGWVNSNIENDKGHKAKVALEG